ncbi:MAG: exo-alpha-sialidase [Verrucomicrobiota bacterium]
MPRLNCRVNCAKLRNRFLTFLLVGWLGIGAALAAPPDAITDWRNIRSGWVIPDEGYCDQPYIVVTTNGHWLCTLTTGHGQEGQRGQHVAATISSNQGRTWSHLINIEPADGPEASWAVPLVTPGGRVYVFYDYNGDQVETLGDRRIRADMLGWYVFRFSDDHGRTWSKERYRLPVRVTACDRANDWAGAVQIFWGISKPITFGSTALFGFTKLGRYMLENGEGWFFRSDNILTEPDPNRIHWQMLPEGDQGLRAPEFGSIQEEHNIVVLSDGTLFCMYRTTMDHPCQAYSRDGGRTWSRPEPAVYSPGGRRFKHPRACPKIWKAKNGRFLFWFQHHGGKDFLGRNPAWICGGVEKDGQILWSQPEILLYDEDPNTRMSYPDLIEQDGHYWITETQKTIARVHPIDSGLLEDLWRQADQREVAKAGLVFSAPTQALRAGEVAAPEFPNLDGPSGFSLDFWIRFDELTAGQVILEAHRPGGQGLAVSTTSRRTVQLELNDGQVKSAWDCDAGLLKPHQLHHLAIIVDRGPRIITFVVDGLVCDGGTGGPYGWGRIDPALRSVNGAPVLKIAPSLQGELKSLRIYDRPLRHAEAIGNFHCPPPAE